MQIQINTDNHIESSERLVNFFSNEVSNELERFDNLITRVEVHSEMKTARNLVKTIKDV